LPDRTARRERKARNGRFVSERNQLRSKPSNPAIGRNFLAASARSLPASGLPCEKHAYFQCSNERGQLKDLNKLIYFWNNFDNGYKKDGANRRHQNKSLFIKCLRGSADFL
jgi:hypothetical protein